MRCLPTFSESSFSLSFFLTTPAKKPRTECACQPVASIMSAIVVPLARCSKDSTVFCFEREPLAGCSEMAFDAAFSFDLRAVVLVERAALGARLLPRGGLAVRFLD